MFKSKILLLLFVFTNPLFCHVDRNPGKSLGVQNNSDERIYFWQSGIWDKHHYPDTILPSELPAYINSVPSGGIAGASLYDSDWSYISSNLPEGVLSTYFFRKLPQNQEDWEMIITKMTFQGST